MTEAEQESALASDAERGYDPAQIVPAHITWAPGRPRAEVISVRVPPELRRALEARAGAERTSVSEIVRDAFRHGDATTEITELDVIERCVRALQSLAGDQDAQQRVLQYLTDRFRERPVDTSNDEEDRS